MPIPWLTGLVDRAHRNLVALPQGHDAWGLLYGRGVQPQWVTEYRIGWIPDAHSLIDPAQPISEDFWKWLLRYGWGKLLFPMTDPWGHPIGLQVRSVQEKGYVNWVDPVAKQLVPPSFGLHVALPGAFTTQRIVLVEGIFDYFALRPHTSMVLAALTSKASTVLRRTLTRYCTDVIALFDMDVPGRRGCYKLAGMPIPPELRDPKDPVIERPKLPPYQVAFPVYTEHDPDDLRKAGKQDELARLARFGEAYRI